MKRLVAIGMISISILMAGCGESESGVNFINIDSLPSDITLKGTTLKVTNTEIYQEQSSDEGHPYYFSAVITIDKSEISDDDLYWLLKNENGKPLTADCHLTSEKNETDYESIPEVTDYYDDDNYYLIFNDYNNEYRYPLTDAELSIDIDAEQEDTYTHDGKEYHKTSHYSFDVNKSDGEIKAEVKDISDMPVSQYAQLCNGLQSTAEFFQSLDNGQNN